MSQPGSPHLCFVVTSHDPAAFKIRDDILDPALHDAGYAAVFSDNIEHGDRLAPTIWAAIEQADLFVAILTGDSPHVFYELGIAQGLKKKTLVLATSDVEIPFDTSHLELLRFMGHGPRAKTVAEKIAVLTS